MNYLIQKIRLWMQRPGYTDPDENLSAIYLQSLSSLIILSGIFIGVVYAFERHSFYLIMTALVVLIYAIVFGLVRFRLLRIASNLFLIAAVGLLTFGIFSSGGIHSSSSIMYPVILVFASLLLDRRSYIVYGLLAVILIGFVIYAENQGFTPVPYVPDPPSFSLFATYTLTIIATGTVIRLVTEGLQNSSKKARQYAQEIVAQKTMLERVGQAVVGCTLDDTIIYWNQAAADIYGWSEEEALGRKYYDLIPTNMTAGMTEMIAAAMRKGDVWSGEFTLENRNRQQLHVLGTIAPLRDDSGKATGWIGVAADLTERRQVESELRQREAILEAVTFAAEQFLKTPDWRENIDNVLERLGRTMHATHAYLFEDHLNPQGEPVTSMRYEWTAPGYPSDLESGNFQNSLIHQEGYEEQVERMQRGEVRFGNASTFNPIEKQAMDELGVKSILEVPVFVNGRTWGAIGFDDFETEREWGQSEVDVLKIAAGILSSAIQRQDAESAVQESERIYRQAIQAAGMVPYYRDYVNHRYAFVGDGIKEITGYSSAELTPELWERMEVKSIPRGSMAHLTYEEADRLTEEGVLNHWECDYLIVNRNGQERWVSDSCIQVRDDKNVRVGVVGILQNITDRKLTEASLRKRESLLEAIAFSAEQFLKAPDWRDGIDTVLERLGREFNVSHAYLFEKHVGHDGTKVNSLRYEWAAPGQQSDMDNPLYQNAPEHEAEFDRYYEVLNRGEPYVGSSSYFTKDERREFDKAGIKAILELRIIVNGQQWGTLGFDDKVHDREWSDVEVDVIRTAANILGAAIKRQLDEDALKSELAERARTERALRFSEEKFSKAFHTTQVLMTIEDDKNLFIDVNQAFEHAFGIQREETIGHSASELDMFYNLTDRDRLQQEYKEKGFLKDFEVRFHRRSGEIGVVLLSSEKFFVEGAEYTLTSGLDITERKRVEHQIQQHAARADVLASLSHSLTQVNQDYHLMLNTVVQRCAELIGDGASIFTFSPGSELLKLAAVHNPDLESVKIFRDEMNKHPIKWNEGAYAQAIGENRPVLIPVIDVEGMIERASLERREYYRKLPFHSMMLAPLHVQGNVIGVIGMARHSPGRAYTSDDLTFLQDIADRCALAMLNTRYYRELEQELAERKRLEQELQNERDFALQIINNLGQGLTVTDADGYFQLVNPAFARLIGHEPDDLIGNSPSAFTFSDSQEILEKARLDRRKGITTTYESKLVHKDGTGIPVLVTGAPRLKDGKFSGSITSITDLTEIKWAQQERERLIAELSARNAESETLRETTTIVTSTLDVSEAVQRILEQLKRVVPYDSASVWLYDGNVARLVGTDGLSGLLDENMQYLVDETEPDYRFISEDIPYILLDDVQENYPQFREPPSNFIHGWLAVALKARGNLIGFISLDSQLPGSFAERDAQLALNYANQVSVALENARLFSDLQRELDGRKKLIDDLENKNVELEQFTYTVSHDLKSPLVTINGFLGYLEEDATSGNRERLKKDIQRINEAVQKMQRLLNELLELSRIGRMMNAPEDIPFGELVDEAINIVYGRLKERKIVVHTAPNLPVIYGDRPRLVEVMQNLIDNAAKYMSDQPNPRIEIGQHGEGKERGMPVLFVKDNGMGIDPEHHERIFGLFNKLDAKSEGTGVGLALVKRIIEFHGGRIWVESKAGEGATFFFTLRTGPLA